MIKYNFIPIKPNETETPSVLIEGEEEVYKVVFIDKDSNSILKETIVKNNTIVHGNRQWYTNWLIQVIKPNGVIESEFDFNIKGQRVFIKMDSWGLGDTLAWIPYVEEFRKEKNANIICSTFFNDIIAPAYPNIIFVPPNTKIDNIYTQYYLGDNWKFGKSGYAPSYSFNQPLQKIASDFFNMEFREIKPNVVNPNWKPPLEKKYVCLSNRASSNIKEWNVRGGWDAVVDLFKGYGYEVVTISKESSGLDGVIERTGEIPLINRINAIKHADFFIGLSSGLSWLSWAIGTPVIMISDYTPPYHEFQTNILRIYNENHIRQEIIKKAHPYPVSVESVLNKIKGTL